MAWELCGKLEPVLLWCFTWKCHLQVRHAARKCLQQALWERVQRRKKANNSPSLLQGASAALLAGISDQSRMKAAPTEIHGRGKAATHSINPGNLRVWTICSMLIDWANYWTSTLEFSVAHKTASFSWSTSGALCYWEGYIDKEISLNKHSTLKILFLSILRNFILCTSREHADWSLAVGSSLHDWYIQLQGTGGCWKPEPNKYPRCTTCGVLLRAAMLSCGRASTIRSSIVDGCAAGKRRCSPYKTCCNADVVQQHIFPIIQASSSGLCFCVSQPTFRYRGDQRQFVKDT